MFRLTVSWLLLGVGTYTLHQVSRGTYAWRLSTCGLIGASLFWGVVTLAQGTLTIPTGEIVANASRHYEAIAFFIAGIALFNMLVAAPNRGERRVTIDRVRAGINAVSARRVVGLFAVGYVAYQFLLIRNGYTYYGSGTLERNLSVSYLEIILLQMLPPALYGLSCIVLFRAVMMRKVSGDSVVVLIMFLSMIVLNRREYLSLGIVLMLILALLGRSVFSLRLLIPMGALTAFLLTFVLPFVTYVRFEHQSLRMTGVDVSLLEVAGTALTLEPGRIQSAYEANLSERLNYERVNAEVMNAVGERRLGGGVFLYQASNVIPRFLNPAKISDQYGSFPERVVQDWLGVRHTDWPDNLPLYGYIDLGLLGSLLAGLIYAFTLNLMERATYAETLPFGIGTALVLGYSIFVTTRHEMSYTELFSDLRSVLVLLAATFLLVQFRPSRRIAPAMRASLHKRLVTLRR